jgi:hypothetical protein
MANERPKIEPKIIRIPEGRVSFYRPELHYRTDRFGNEVKTDPKTGKAKKPQATMTWLLDPSNAQAAATIKEIKDEALRQLDIFFNGRSNWPKDNETTGTKGVLFCFGEGNKLKKVYDGYKDMFYVKVADNTPPIIGDRRGRQVELLSDNAWHIVDRQTGKTTEETVSSNEVPYGGAFCTGRISLYVYNNEQAGVNANFRSVQFVRPGEAFGGAKRTAADELADMPGDSAPAAGTAGKDPWD